MNPRQTIPPNGQRITILALVFSLLLATLKIACGFLGQSQALMADGMESIADVFSSLTVWGGLHMASRPPDRNHPFGHGKAESLAGLLVGFMMLGAALAIARNSLLDLPGPHTPPKAWTLLVLVAVMLAKEGMFRWMRAAGKRLNSTALENEAAHHRADAITSLAAFIGISVAIVGGPDWSVADNWAALFASMLIAANALRILRRSLGEVMDESVSPAILAEARKLAATHPEVLAVDQCRIRKSGLGLWMDIHILVDGNLSVRKGHAIGHEVETTLMKSELPIHDVVVHVEPEDAHPELLPDP